VQVLASPFGGPSVKAAVQDRSVTEANALLLATWHDLSDARLAEALDDHAIFRRILHCRELAGQCKQPGGLRGLVRPPGG
jgi:hypothetical protein